MKKPKKPSEVEIAKAILKSYETTQTRDLPNQHEQSPHPE
jgi:hypothetical protein